MMKSTATLQKSIQKTTTDFRSHVDSLRGEIAALQEECSWLETGPLPPMEVIDLIHAHIDGLADQFDIQGKLGGATFAGRNLRDELKPLFAVSGNISNARSTGGVVTGFADTNAGPTLAHFFGDQLKATLAKDVESMDYQAGPPAAERADLIADLDTRIYDLETQEESLIEAAESSGIEILRQPNCNAAIVLDFRIIEEEMLDEPAYQPVTVREV